jgi:hypothetical protein
MKSEYALQLVALVIFSCLFLHAVFCWARSPRDEHTRKIRQFVNLGGICTGTALLYISIAAFTDDTAGKAIGAIGCVVLLLVDALMIVLIAKEIKTPTP